MSEIARIRTPRDLAESILLPSATIANGYETILVVTDHGRTYQGVLGRQTPKAIHLRPASKPEIRIPRERIAEIVPQPTSIMPAGLEKTITASELRDLLAFLQTLK